MKVAFLTKSLETYNQGFYYEDWQNNLAGKLSADIFHIPTTNAFDIDSLSRYTHLILGHSFVDYLSELRSKSPLKSPRRILESDTLLKTISTLHCRKILLSKNDYKGINNKKTFAKLIGIDYFVTHSLSALPSLTGSTFIPIWLPFGSCDKSFYFSDTPTSRPVDIGFIGNTNSLWNNGERESLINLANVYLAPLFNLDIRTGAKEFLRLTEYREWMNTIRFAINSESAISTVGPKWWEQMLCGVVPIAPISTYEGLLLPYQNYIPLDVRNPDIDRLSRDLRDTSIQARILESNSEYVKSFTTGVIVDKLIETWL